jgi:hypothetical protein
MKYQKAEQFLGFILCLSQVFFSESGRTHPTRVVEAPHVEASFWSKCAAHVIRTLIDL